MASPARSHPAPFLRAGCRRRYYGVKVGGQRKVEVPPPARGYYQRSAACISTH